MAGHKVPHSLTHAIDTLCQSMGAGCETCCYRKYKMDFTRPDKKKKKDMTWQHPPPPPVKKFKAMPLGRELMITVF